MINFGFVEIKVILGTDFFLRERKRWLVKKFWIMSDPLKRS